MNKTELATAVAKKTGMTKMNAEAAVKATLETITKAVAEGEMVQLIGFGSFSLAERAARIGRNPHTGEEIKIPATKTIKFKTGKLVRTALNS